MRLHFFWVAIFCWEDDTTLQIRRDSEIDQSRISMKHVYVEMGYVYKFSWLTLVLPTKWSGSEHLEPNLFCKKVR